MIKKILFAILGVVSFFLMSVVSDWKKTGKIGKISSMVLSLVLFIFGLANFYFVAPESITSAATFGYSSQGEDGNNINDKIRGSKFTILEAGTADKMSAYLFNASGSVGVTAAIYKSSDNSKIAESSETVMIPGGPRWLEMDFDSESLVSDTEYILVIISEGNVYLHSDYEVNKGIYQNYTYGSLPSTLSPTLTNRKESIYCTYTQAEVSARRIININ